jgi:hypothetical protein
MRRSWLVLAFVLLWGAVFAQDVKEFTVSGVLDSRITAQAGAENVASSFGAEEYANIRLQAKIRDAAVFYGAFNFIAAAGSYAAGAGSPASGSGPGSMGSASFSFVTGENYAAGMELERLYFRVNREAADFEGGLMRLAFGYGQVFGPSDFLNPKNPLNPDARHRGILGGVLSVYPDSFRFRFYGAAPKNPLRLDGGGGLAGLSADQHWDRASLQVLYVYETPADFSRFGKYRAGLSLKADFETSFTVDFLYTANPEKGTGIQGFSASGGFDYSFYKGKFFVLAEYLYNGEDSSTSVKTGNRYGFSREHYLYASLKYLINDYTSLMAASLFNASDFSARPLLSAEYELFQGLTISALAQFPLDHYAFTGSGGRGELGPTGGAGRFIFTAGARLRF